MASHLITCITQLGSVTCSLLLSASTLAASPPNIILLMSDDQGWGDVAYNGNSVVKTPHLDRMAREGLQLNRFYAAAPVCSPTRGSVLTGRHPFRYGIEWAGIGHMRADEMTLAETLKAAGYATGHFGKWHVGELSRSINQSYFEGELADPAHYSPPWDNGFDVSFSTESMMPTYNPYYYLGGDFGTDDYRHLQTEPVAKGQREGGFRWRDHFWTGPGQLVDEWLEGDDSEIVMDRALAFIRQQQALGKPSLTLIWFHTPHTPLAASDEDRAGYAKQPLPAQHWYGAITAMDRQVGRLRQQLRTLGMAENTLLWFNSDNGPSYIHDYNSAGPFKGKKATLHEGGIRVPAIIEWPAGLEGRRQIDSPLSTSDIYPTLLAAAGVALPEKQPTLDGENILPLLNGKRTTRHAAIAFQSPIRGAKYAADRSKLQYALSGDRYKLYSGDAGVSWQLYDLIDDPGETTDVADKQPTITTAMREQLQGWIADTRRDFETDN